MPYIDIDGLSALKGVLLGIDHGTKTIGLAISNQHMNMALPLYTLRKTKQLQDFAHINALIKEKDVVAIVLGYPLNIDGSSGPRAQSVRAFARNFLIQNDIPLLLWDERYSTSAVEDQMINEMNMSRQKRKDYIDALAAQYILKSALDRIAIHLS